MTIEEQIKKMILERYTSMKRFCIECDIGYNTLISILRRGVGNAGVSTMLKLCESLQIDANSLFDNELTLLSEPEEEIATPEPAAVYSTEEKRLVDRYREQGEMQSAVKRLLRMD